MAVEFLEGVSISCLHCRYAVVLPPDSRPFHPLHAPVAEMPDSGQVCEKCKRPLIINWRNMVIEETEAAAPPTSSDEGKRK